MKGKQTHFFATRTDLVALMESVELARQISYAEFGLIDSPEATVYETLLA